MFAHSSFQFRYVASRAVCSGAKEVSRPCDMPSPLSRQLAVQGLGTSDCKIEVCTRHLLANSSIDRRAQPQTAVERFAALHFHRHLVIRCAKPLHMWSTGILKPPVSQYAVIIEQSNRKSTHQSCATCFKWFRESIVRVPGLQSLWLKRTSRFPNSRCITIREIAACFSNIPGLYRDCSLRLGVSAEHPIQHRRFDRPLLERSRYSTARIRRQRGTYEALSIS